MSPAGHLWAKGKPIGHLIIRIIHRRDSSLEPCLENGVDIFSQILPNHSQSGMNIQPSVLPTPEDAPRPRFRGKQGRNGLSALLSLSSKCSHLVTKPPMAVICLVSTCLGALDPGMARAEIFSPNQTGLYVGKGNVRSVVDGVTNPPENVQSRIRVKPNTVVLDGTAFRFSKTGVRAWLWDFGLGIGLDGTFRKSGKRIRASGTARIISLEHNTSAEGTWRLIFYANGRRASQYLNLLVLDPEDPNVVLGSITGRSTAAKNP